MKASYRMPKRGRSVRDGAADSKKSPAKREQYLYLVVDDWEKGYSVRKLDVGAMVSGADAEADGDADDEPELLAEPPVARFEAVHGNSHCFVAHGTKILAMRPAETSPAIPAFDTATLATAIIPWPEFRMDFGLPVLVSLAGKIFLFMHRTYYLGDPPPPRSTADVFPPPELKPWAWTTIESPLPFRASYVVAYAVHPDGHTLFVSTERCASGSKGATFSFDSETLAWTHRGDWLLPFYRQGHYDAKMDAWVGLCRNKVNNAGHLCSCEIVPVTGAGLAAPPSWKLGQNRLFHKESGSHLGATLVHMGRSKFCLVESMWHKQDDPMAMRHIVLRIATFGLKYDNKGRLRLRSRRGQVCKMFKRADDDMLDLLPNPIAFWI